MTTNEEHFDSAAGIRAQWKRRYRMTLQTPWEEMVEADAEVYNRQRDLIDKKLLAIWPREGDDYSIAGTYNLIKHLQRVLRATYRAALQGHWSYSVTRHVALLGATRAEQARLKQMIEQRLEEESHE